MTAEVIVMNKLAVAAAADSAVTITVRGGQKIYQSANKLFALGKHVPVGIMVYGNADFMAVPWETIVKTYRSRLTNKTFPTIDEYAKDFLSFLENNKRLFPKRAQELFVEADCRAFLTHFGKELKSHLEQALKDETDIPDSRVAELLLSRIQAKLAELRANKPVPSLPRGFPRKVEKKYSTQIDRAINSVFKDIPLTQRSRQTLRTILGEIFFRQLIGNPSGVVIMGFGAADVFPKATEHLVRGIIADHLWCVRTRYQALGLDKSASIIPFAQSEMVSTFMEGVDPELADFLMGMFGTLLTGYIDQVADALPELQQPQRDQFRERIARVCQEQLSQLEKGFNEYRREKHVDPIMTMISALPKDELARVAEALVNLTSFKRRVSAQAETVAEPIDVAVISRGDGFVWVKRKHYFPAALNPGWGQTLIGDISA